MRKDLGSLYDVLGSEADHIDIQAIEEYVDERGIEFVWPEALLEEGEDPTYADPNDLQERVEEGAVVVGSKAFWDLVNSALSEAWDRWVKAVEEMDECGLLHMDNGMEYVRHEGPLYDMLLTALRHMAARVPSGEVILTYAIDDIRRRYLEGAQFEDLMEAARWWGRAFCALYRANGEEEVNEVLDLLLQGDLEEAERIIG